MKRSHWWTIGIAATAAVAAFQMHTTFNYHAAYFDLAGRNLKVEYNFYDGLIDDSQNIRLIDRSNQKIGESNTERPWKVGVGRPIIYRNLKKSLYYVFMLEGLYEISFDPPAMRNICILGAETEVEYVGEFRVRSPNHDGSLEANFEISSTTATQDPHDGNNHCG